MPVSIFLTYFFGKNNTPPLGILPISRQPVKDKALNWQQQYHRYKLLSSTRQDIMDCACPNKGVEE